MSKFFWFFSAFASLSFGQERPNWTSSKIIGTPEAPSPWVPELIWSQHDFSEVLEVVHLPGHVLVIENQGKVWQIERAWDSKKPKKLLLDLRQKHAQLDHLYGFALSPRWQQNQEIYLTYTVGAGLDDGTRLSRFRVQSTEDLTIRPESEEVLLTWLSGGHNGAHLQFGPDQMLYVSTGDAEAPAPPDARNTGQDNRDLLSAILRLDVEHREPNQPYRIPADNPFLGKSEVRPEIWAFGFRNPWKISFDSKARLWCGDVGWELWEMIHLVSKGTNHGWSAMEATQPIKPELLSPLAPITPPVVAHPHTEAASITGGYVYESSQFPELKGAYIYGDYETGKIWALWHENGQIQRHEEIADTPHKIVTFGWLDDGEIIYAHWGKPSAFYRLIRRPEAPSQEPTFPQNLSQTGLFRSLAKLEPAEGVFTFEIAEPLWQDGLVASQRLLALPGNSHIHTQQTLRKDGSVAATKTTWPTHAVLAKTISVPNPKQRHLETQLLHYDGESWKGYSYLWNEEQTEAKLAGPSGMEIPYTDADGQVNQHKVPARAECARCHTPWAGFSLGFQAVQLTQIAEGPPEEAALALNLTNDTFFKTTPVRLVTSRDAHAPLQDRARSWLHANCAHCHRTHGGGSVPLKLNADLPLEEAAIIGEKPLRGELGIEHARLAAPGFPWQSVLLARIARTGTGRMPMIGSQQVDQHGYQLLYEWIQSLGNAQPALKETHPLPASARLHKPDLTQPISSVPQALSLLAQNKMNPTALQSALKSKDIHLQPLFERFLPPDQRRKAIGLQPASPHLLSLRGLAARGASLLAPDGRLASCLGCHYIFGTGREFGPDLSHVGSRLTKAQILESLLKPSAQVRPEYQAYQVTLPDGTLHSGFLTPDSTRSSLKLFTGQTIPLKPEDKTQLKALPGSLMPEGLLQSLTPDEVADLLEYLSELK